MSILDLVRSRVQTNEESPTGSSQEERDRLSYELLFMRTLNDNSNLWQTPVLAMTAQAFLLTIALNSSADWKAKAVAAAFGMVVAAASAHLIIKHRFFLDIDIDFMEELENELGLHPLAKRGWAFTNQVYSRRGKSPSYLQTISSFQLWRTLLIMFVVVDAALLVLALLQSETGEHFGAWIWRF